LTLRTGENRRNKGMSEGKREDAKRGGRTEGVKGGAKKRREE
jgi:hypothetical protein